MGLLVSSGSPTTDDHGPFERPERLAGWVAERFPGAQPQPVGTDTCLYTTTADERGSPPRKLLTSSLD